MVVSGLTLFTEAAGQVVTTNTVAISYAPLSNGLTTQLQWRQQFFALAFEFDDGFEFERSIPFSELPDAKQRLAKKLGRGADRLFVEEVFAVDKHFYELYAYHNGTFQTFDLTDDEQA